MDRKLDLGFFLHILLEGHVKFEQFKDFNDLQIRDYRADWDLQVNQPVAGNYYPVCFCRSRKHCIYLYCLLK